MNTDNYCLIMLIFANFIFPRCLQHQNQASGYASQHIWCLFQARITWEGCGSKGIWRKNGGMTELGRWLVWMEWCPARFSVCLSHVIFPCTIKPRRRFLLAPAHPGSPRKRAVKWLCVCVWGCVGEWHQVKTSHSTKTSSVTSREFPRLNVICRNGTSIKHLVPLM